jgi:hypothetical protein
MENIHKAFHIAGVNLEPELINVMVRLVEQGADPKAVSRCFKTIRNKQK